MTSDTESKEYWNNRYQAGLTSGAGSYGPGLELKLNWLKDLDIQTIFELGCGDFNFGWRLTLLYPDATYVGVDMSEVIIKKNQEIAPKQTFRVGTDVESADLILCIDVLLHVISEETLENLLNQLESKWTKYLAITAYERDEPMDQHVRIRKFDFRRFGRPLIRQVVEEDGQMFFYLFKRP